LVLEIPTRTGNSQVNMRTLAVCSKVQARTWTLADVVGVVPSPRGLEQHYVADELAVLSRQARDYAPFHTAVIPQKRRCGT
jgi:hypothetical protein